MNVNDFPRSMKKEEKNDKLKLDLDHKIKFRNIMFCIKVVIPLVKVSRLRDKLGL